MEWAPRVPKLHELVEHMRVTNRQIPAFPLSFESHNITGFAHIDSAIQSLRRGLLCPASPRRFGLFTRLRPGGGKGGR